MQMTRWGVASVYRYWGVQPLLGAAPSPQLSFRIGCAIGSSIWRMRARVFWVMGAGKRLTFFDGCAQRFFEERMRATVGVSPGCVQPTWWMRATPLTIILWHVICLEIEFQIQILFQWMRDLFLFLSGSFLLLSKLSLSHKLPLWTWFQNDISRHTKI